MGCQITYATSGAILMSDVSRLSEMLWPRIDALEIGSLASEEDLRLVLREVRRSGVALGLHAPLWRGGMGREGFDAGGLTLASRTQRQGNFTVAARCGAQYVVLHFHWFKDGSLPPDDAREHVAAALSAATFDVVEQTLESSSALSGSRIMAGNTRLLSLR